MRASSQSERETSQDARDVRAALPPQAGCQAIAGSPTAPASVAAAWARARAVMGRQGARQDVVETTACRRERPGGAASGLAGRRELADDPRGLPGLHSPPFRPPAE